MKIAYITSGAAGSFCGSCIHDNTLAAALIDLGHDALLIPTYTPIRTDETDVTSKRVFFGGINVYLQQKSRLFRWTPWFLDRLLDFRWLLNGVSRFAGSLRYDQLGALALSMLEGEHGNQRKELDKLTAWLEADFRPDVIQFTNLLIGGIAPRLKKTFGVPVLGMLQGDDVFLDALPPEYRRKAIDLMRRNDPTFDGYIVTSAAYADYMADYLKLDRHKMHVVYPGLNLKFHKKNERTKTEPPLAVGYFARMAPEKGFHVFCQAFRLLQQMPGVPRCVARASGYLGSGNQAYFEACKKDLVDFEYVDSPDAVSKNRFLESLDVFSVPAVFHEPKGLYVLEAWAHKLPVVQPRSGSFPELIERTGGGLLVEPENPAALAQAWKRLLEDPVERRELGEKGYAGLHAQFHAAAMAQQTLDVYRRYLR